MKIPKRRWAVFNKTFFWVVLVLALAAVVDLVRTVAAPRPVLAREGGAPVISRPVPPIPEILFSRELFQSSQAVQPVVSAQIAVKDVQWKLKGVLVGPVKKAFLEDAGGTRGLWVMEGEQVDDYTVKSIQEQAVFVERGGEVYEIRM